ncbi:RagB/SusD family nutrient uptake outer membrane protein [Polaribacter sp. ALD11]|uniref:RagB/SusD family nutrient uptake outer membrane protein n=1 Tax=Polaribacter sp. ALD11 TaxID=2058137 RepID=UPI000C30A62D|nr:RagB/SusD family nutrient uptake outer membrane protein [Polaribacter sp. ALD11]AUC86393.1 RagB/SusD family nutrient uptake outer membrane protein [Polaribacter sp. ALD11]
MKILYKKITKVTALLFLFSLVACNDYLSELPDDRTTINSGEKIKALITGAYPQGNYMLMAELMSDNALSKPTNNGVANDLLHEQMFNWEESIDLNQDSPTAYWVACYEAIAQANQALESIEELKNQFNLDAEKGEALIARAYAHFMLVNFWGKHFDPSTANSDLGIPYVTKPETVLIQKYTRNTVKEVYDFIERDLNEGLKLIKNREENPKFHFSKESGQAFAVRFYTYKGDWDQVILNANELLINPRLQVRDMVAYRTLSYGERTFRYNNTLEDANILVNSVSSWWARSFASTNYGLLSGSDIFTSGNPLNKQWAYQTFGGDKFSNLPKFDEYFKITNQSAGTGFGLTPQVLFSYDEVLLNRAEAYAMKENYTNSLKDLTDFLSKKTVGFNNGTDNLTAEMVTDTYPVIANELTPSYGFKDDKQTSFVKAVLSFKQKEFYHEGLRWFDVRRFNIEIKRAYKKQNSFVSEITLAKDDLRRQMQIPESATNIGLIKNPR